MTLESEIKKKLNGLRHTVENTWNAKVEIENRNELTEEEKEQRKKALRDEQAKELTKKKREIKQFLEENKTEFEEIPESEPSTSKEVTKATRFQGRAKERLDGLDDPSDLNNAVQSEFEDPTKPDGYKRELWKMAKSKLENIGKDPGSYYSTVLNNLRRKHLMTDEERSKLKKTEAVEDVTPLVEFTSNYLVKSLDEKIFADKLTAPDTGSELEDRLDNIFDQGIKAIQERIEKHKPKAKNAG